MPMNASERQNELMRASLTGNWYGLDLRVVRRYFPCSRKSRDSAPSSLDRTTVEATFLVMSDVIRGRNG